MYKPAVVTAILWICVILILSIIFNLFATYGAEYGRTVPVPYVHRVHTIHFRCFNDCGKHPDKPDAFQASSEPVPYLEYQKWTGLNDYTTTPTVQVLVRDIDPRLIYTTSMIFVVCLGIGFISGYGARKTN